jgi:hypothetical protein
MGTRGHWGWTIAGGIVVWGLALSGCGKALTERYCRQAADERARNAPSGRVFPRAQFLAACARLPAQHAQCTIPSFAGSYVVLQARECREAYSNPAFPRDIILGIER